MRRTIWWSLILATAFLGCGDDPASPPPIPDLRMQDVVGCWEYVDSVRAYYQCFDSAGAFTQRSAGLMGIVSEDTGRYWLDRYYLRYRSSWVASNGRYGTTKDGVALYRREGNFLFSCDGYGNKTDAVYARVDLSRDTVFIRKHIFQLLPKPAGWTLF